MFIVLTAFDCTSTISGPPDWEYYAENIIPEFQDRLLFDNCWSAAGATGVVDQNSRDMIKLGEFFPPDIILPPGSQPDPTRVEEHGSCAYLLSGKSGIYHIRYPVNQQFLFRINTEKTQINKWYIQMNVRYKVANKERERIVVNLNRYKINTPPKHEKIETILRWDSENFAASNDFQNKSTSKGAFTFDFRNYVYFLDAMLINKPNNGLPSRPFRGVGTALGMIQLCQSTEPID